MMLYNTIVPHTHTHAHKNEWITVYLHLIWTCVHVWKKVSSVSKRMHHTPGSQLPQKTAPIPPTPIIRMSSHSPKKRKKCANYNLVVQSQPRSGPGCNVLRKKWRPLRTCLGMRTALRHPWVSWFSGLVCWSWGTPVLAVLLSFFFSLILIIH